MNATLVIARRELEEKKFVFIAAAALAVLVLLMPLVPGVPAGNGRSVVVVASAILGVAFVLGLAAILGTTMIGRELSEKRLSFYFSKPIPAASIWAGKLIAAAILLTATFLIVAAPGFAAGQKAIQQVWSGEASNGIAFLAILVAVFFFLGHILSTIARARSAWAFVDLVAAAALAFGAWLIIRPLLDAHALLMGLVVIKTAGWLLLIAAILAGAWQLSVGRTDRQRSHLALMRFLWPAAAVAIGIAGLIVLWVVMATPADLRGRINTATAPGGKYTVIGGETRNRLDYRAQFLMNVKTGEYERLGGVRDIEFLKGGEKALVFRPINRRTNTAEVMIRDLAKGAKEQPTGLTISRWHGVIASSDDTRLLAYNANDLVGVYDVVNQKSLGSIKIPDGAYLRAMWFATPDVLRLHTITGSKLGNLTGKREARMYEYNLRTRQLQQTGSYEQMSNRFLFTVISPDRRSVVVRLPEDAGAAILDSRTLAPLSNVSIPAQRHAFLDDGRMIGLLPDKLVVFTSNGAVEREVAIPGANPTSSWFVRELTNGKVLAAGRTRDGSGSIGWAIYAVDANTGAVLRETRDLEPLIGGWWTRESLGENVLVRDASGSILRFDPVTNEKMVLVPHA